MLLRVQLIVADVGYVFFGLMHGAVDELNFEMSKAVSSVSGFSVL